MRDIIQRDLAYLLNTTNLGDEIDARRYPRVAASTVNYGVPPLAGAFMATRNWEHIEQVVKDAILAFEPRLIPAALRVVPRSDGDRKGKHNQVAFEIHGMIRMNPYPLQRRSESGLRVRPGGPARTAACQGTAA